MPRPILHRPVQKTESESRLSATLRVNEKAKQKAATMNPLQLARVLRKPRSKKYLDMIKQLDAGGHVETKEKVQQMADILREEFPEVELSGMLVGIVAKCYLGEPYEVHTLDILGDIIHHYKRGEPLPGRLEKARNLASNEFYLAIEVYTDCCRAVAENGTVSVIKG